MTQYVMICRGYARPELSCPFEGQYLKAFTPKERVKGEFTRDPNEALKFASKGEAFTLWKTAIGTRRDGQPDRPLTAFNMEIAPIYEAYK